MSDALSESGVAPLLRADPLADKPWLDALRTAQSAAAFAHTQTLFWMRLRHIAFARDVELHPKLIALFALWSGKCACESLPVRHQFPVAELRPWLGHLALIERRGEDFLFRLCGTDLIARFGGEATGRILHTCQAPHASLRAALVEACETHAPVPAVTVTTANDDPVTWSEIVLPLAGGDGQIARLFVGSYPLQAPPR
jgi:hypothetical protein